MRSVRCFDWFILLWCHWTNLGLLPKWQLWATFFISIIKIISIIGLICIMIQCKMLLLNQWLQKKWPISNLCSDQIKKLILYFSSASLINVFPPSVCRSVRLSVVPSIHPWLIDILLTVPATVFTFVSGEYLSLKFEHGWPWPIFADHTGQRSRLPYILSIYKAPF